MKTYLPFALPTLLLATSCASAEPVKWLEDGADMHATTTEISQRKQETAGDAAEIPKVTVTLATGQEVILTGGVYVKTQNTAAVLAWAMTNNYIALESPYISGAINVQTTPEESIAVANAIAQLDGVTTAAPKYRMPVVAK